MFFLWLTSIAVFKFEIFHILIVNSCGLHIGDKTVISLYMTFPLANGHLRHPQAHLLLYQSQRIFT